MRYNYNQIFEGVNFNLDIYQHRRHNKNLLMVHLIFVTKYRKKILLSNFREDIKQSIFDSCITHRWYIRRMETDKDHIHIQAYRLYYTNRYYTKTGEYL
mgnify:CR=1 FL=1